MRANLYESVTNTIIKQMEAGTIPWTAPWKQAKGVAYVPTNVATGQRYNGINVLILWAAAMERNYLSHGWMGYSQAKAIGANVRKGEKGTTIFFIKTTEIEEDGETRTLAYSKPLTVFHVSQIENLGESYQVKDEPTAGDTAYEEALKVIRESGVRFEYHHRHSAYAPKRDVVEMPPKSLFESEEEFYGVCFHELAHASGSKDRLNRDLTGRYKSKSYAMEECVAEMASAFLCAHVGIPARHRCPAYVKDWLTVLKEDPKAIFTAASHASKAADWVLEQGYAVQDDTPECEKLVASI